MFVLRALYDSPSAILFPTPPGWNDDAWTYACVLVGFVYVLMSSVCMVFVFVYGHVQEVYFGL